MAASPPLRSLTAEDYPLATVPFDFREIACAMELTVVIGAAKAAHFCSKCAVPTEIGRI